MLMTHQSTLISRRLPLITNHTPTITDHRFRSIIYRQQSCSITHDTHPPAIITNNPPFSSYPPLNSYVWLIIYCHQSHTTYYWPFNNWNPSFIASGHDQSHTIPTRQHITLITHHPTLISRRLPLITDHAPLITDHSSITTHYWPLTSTRPY